MQTASFEGALPCIPNSPPVTRVTTNNLVSFPVCRLHYNTASTSHKHIIHQLAWPGMTDSVTVLVIRTDCYQERCCNHVLKFCEFLISVVLRRICLEFRDTRRRAKNTEREKERERGREKKETHIERKKEGKKEKS